LPEHPGGLPGSEDRGERVELVTPPPPPAPSLKAGEVPAPPPSAPGAEAPAVEPIPSDEGTLVAMPPIPPEPRTTPADPRSAAQRQLLTGRAARFGVPLSPARLAWRKLKKNRLAVAGGVVLILLYLVALFAPFLAPYDYDTQDRRASFRPPMRIFFTPGPTVYPARVSYNQYQERIFTEDRSRPIRLRFFAPGPEYRLFGFIPCDRHLYGSEGQGRVYLLGTDQFGRDYLSRLLYASQISLSVGLIGIAITFVLGLLVGGISGFYGGRIDDLIMRGCEIIMSVPQFYLLLALAGSLDPKLSPVLTYILIIGILSFVGWAGMARVIRGMVLSVREREYVEAARALGVSDLKIIVRHILPSTFTYAIVAATLSIPGYILGESGLSFLGIGIREPMASWGNMLSAAQTLSTLEQRLWILAPGLLIFLATLAFNFLGDGLRDALDPKSR
jgi:peptide/nickel transport system permease protein